MEFKDIPVHKLLIRITKTEKYKVRMTIVKTTESLKDLKIINDIVLYTINQFGIYLPNIHLMIDCASNKFKTLITNFCILD